MADEQSQVESESPRHGRIVNAVHALGDWATASRFRAIASLVALAVAVGGTVGGWLYMAKLAASAGVPDWRDALDAYDKGELEQAESIAHRIQQSGTADSNSLGVALFIMGATRANEASQQWSRERRWLDHLVASKYLLKAMEFGVPDERQTQVVRMTGASLIESGRVDKAIEILKRALQEHDDDDPEFHRLLSRAYASQPTPDLDNSLVHSERLLELTQVGDAHREELVVDHATKLGRLGRIAEAGELLATLHDTSSRTAVAHARLDVAAGRALAVDAEFDGDAEKRQLADAKLSSAIEVLQDLPRTDDNWQVAGLLLADAQALAGKRDEAIETLVELRQSQASQQFASLASLAEADLYRSDGDYDQALVAYRRALATLGDPRMYHNAEVPLDELRRRFIVAVEDLQFQREYELAQRLTEELGSVVGRTRQLELLAITLEAWGSFLISESEREKWQRHEKAREGRRRLRQAGVYFEQLAERRFATSEYIDDLWNSCESYFRGQSYTAAIRVLKDYLRYEPEKLNAQALLRLGQSRLAGGDIEAGIAALEEAIELHPNDAATYQARLDCAAGYRKQGNVERAEELLSANLSGSLQSPRSPEWRDSLFALGHLLHDTARYSEAIDRLEEAIDRYPDDDKTRLALYLVADSYREAAGAPLADLRVAKTENERETARREVNRLLGEAIARYEQVQRDIALGADPDVLDRAMLRNCYMMRADALFDLGRYEEASKAYSNVSTLYQREPFVLETYVQIANCYRRMNEPMKAHLTIGQALLALERLPEDADFASTTNFTREQWRLLLEDMSKWSSG